MIRWHNGYVSPTCPGTVWNRALAMLVLNAALRDRVNSALPWLCCNASFWWGFQEANRNQDNKREVLVTRPRRPRAEGAKFQGS